MTNTRYLRLALNSKAREDLDDILKYFIFVLEQHLELPGTIALDTDEQLEALILASIEKFAGVARLAVAEPRNLAQLTLEIFDFDSESGDEREPRIPDPHMMRKFRVLSSDGSEATCYEERE